MSDPYRPIRLIVAGSRTFDDYDYLCRKLDKHYMVYRDITVLSGAAKGADLLGERWAFSWWWKVMRFHPDYEKYGKAAPVYRNQEMAEASTAKIEGSKINYEGHLCAFWDGKSKGTEDMIRKARKWGLKVKVMYYEGKP